MVLPRYVDHPDRLAPEYARGGGPPAPPAPAWPFGTDAHWGSVALMHDFRAGSDFYEYNTPTNVVDQKNGYISNTVNLKDNVYGGYLDNPVDGTNVIWVPNSYGVGFGANAQFTIEAWAACPYGVPGQGQLFFRKESGSGSPNRSVRILRADSSSVAPWSGQMITSSTGSNTQGTGGGRSVFFFYPDLRHYCFVRTATQGRTFSDGVAKETYTSGGYNDYITDWFSTIKARWVAFRITLNSTRYNFAGFTPDTNFGKGLP